MNGSSREKMFLSYATNWLVIRTFRCGHGRADLLLKVWFGTHGNKHIGMLLKYCLTLFFFENI